MQLPQSRIGRPYTRSSRSRRAGALLALGVVVVPLPATATADAPASAPAPPAAPAPATPASARTAVPGICSDTAYLLQKVDDSFGIYALDLLHGTQTKIPNTRIDGSIGYSRKDGFLYVLARNGQLLTRGGPASGIVDSTATSGYPTDTRTHAVASSTNGKKLYALPRNRVLYTLDRDPDSAPYGTVLSAQDVIPRSARVDDFAINPADRFLYGVPKNGRLLRFSPDSGAAEDLTTVPPLHGTRPPTASRCRCTTPPAAGHAGGLDRPQPQRDLRGRRTRHRPGRHRRHLRHPQLDRPVRPAAGPHLPAAAAAAAAVQGTGRRPTADRLLQ